MPFSPLEKRKLGQRGKRAAPSQTKKSEEETAPSLGLGGKSLTSTSPAPAQRKNPSVPRSSASSRAGGERAMTAGRKHSALLRMSVRRESAIQATPSAVLDGIAEEPWQPSTSSSGSGSSKPSAGATPLIDTDAPTVAVPAKKMPTSEATAEPVPRGRRPSVVAGMSVALTSNKSRASPSVPEPPKRVTSQPGGDPPLASASLAEYDTRGHRVRPPTGGPSANPSYMSEAEDQLETLQEEAVADSLFEPHELTRTDREKREMVSAAMEAMGANDPLPSLGQLPPAGHDANAALSSSTGAKNSSIVAGGAGALNSRKSTPQGQGGGARRMSTGGGGGSHGGNLNSSNLSSRGKKAGPPGPTTADSPEPPEKTRDAATVVDSTLLTVPTMKRLLDNAKAACAALTSKVATIEQDTLRAGREGHDVKLESLQLKIEERLLHYERELAKRVDERRSALRLQLEEEVFSRREDLREERDRLVEEFITRNTEALDAKLTALLASATRLEERGKINDSVLEHLESNRERLIARLHAVNGGNGNNNDGNNSDNSNSNADGNANIPNMQSSETDSSSWTSGDDVAVIGALSDVEDDDEDDLDGAHSSNNHINNDSSDAGGKKKRKRGPGDVVVMDYAPPTALVTLLAGVSVQDDVTRLVDNVKRRSTEFQLELKNRLSLYELELYYHDRMTSHFERTVAEMSAKHEEFESHRRGADQMSRVREQWRSRENVLMRRLEKQLIDRSRANERMVQALKMDVSGPTWDPYESNTGKLAADRLAAKGGKGIIPGAESPIGPRELADRARVKENLGRLAQRLAAERSKIGNGDGGNRDNNNNNSNNNSNGISNGNGGAGARSSIPVRHHRPRHSGQGVADPRELVSWGVGSIRGLGGQSVATVQPDTQQQQQVQQQQTQTQQPQMQAQLGTSIHDSVKSTDTAASGASNAAAGENPSGGSNGSGISAFGSKGVDQMWRGSAARGSGPKFTEFSPMHIAATAPSSTGAGTNRDSGLPSNTPTARNRGKNGGFAAAAAAAASGGATRPAVNAPAVPSPRRLAKMRHERLPVGVSFDAEAASVDRKAFSNHTVIKASHDSKIEEQRELREQVRDDPLAVANLAISRMRAKEERGELLNMAKQYLSVTHRRGEAGEAEDIVTDILLTFSRLKSMF